MPVIEEAQERMRSWNESAILDARFRTLTRREREVGAMTVYGMTRQEIALALGTSARTVDSHKLRIHAKLECKNDVALVWRALEIGWVK